MEKTEMVDYNKNDIAIGDTIKNVESSWRGVIREVEGEGVDTMLVCFGVNFWDGKIDEDDKQWHSPFDVIKQPRQAAQPGESINPLNLG